MFIAIPIVLIVIVAAAAFLTGMLDGLLGGGKPKDAAASAAAEAPAGDKGGKPGAPGTGGTVFYDMPEILVNLSSQRPDPEAELPQDSRQLRTAERARRAQGRSGDARIIDNFQVYLRELRVDDLQGSAGMLRLREELLAPRERGG